MTAPRTPPRASSGRRHPGAPPSRRWLPWLLALLVAGPPPAAAQVRPLVAGEYEVKAAFLYNFARFIRWPDGGGGRLPLCVLGEDPFGMALEELADKQGGEWQVTVRRIERPGQAGGCRIVFVSDSERGRLAETLAGLGGLPALIVGDSPGFVDAGGMIGFLMEGRKVRFSVNLEAVRRAGLNLSSQLLRLARQVVGGPVEGMGR